MMDFHRQLDILPIDKVSKIPILIIGAGGIGSPTALMLAKMGFKDITVVDFDIVEPHNLPNQFFQVDQVNKSKVYALKENVKKLTGMEIKAIEDKIKTKKDLQTHLTKRSIVISALDNMKTRKIVFEGCKYNFNCMRLIDCRVTYPYLLLYSVDVLNPDQIKKYEKTLYDDEKSMIAACTAQATFYTAFQSACLIAIAVQNVVLGKTAYYNVMMSFDPLQLIIHE